MPITTRPTNANKRPGLVITKKGHRTKAEMEAARAEEVEKKSQKEKAQKEKEQKVAEIENNIESTDMEIAAGRVTQTRPLQRQGAIADISKAPPEKKKRKRKEDPPQVPVGDEEDDDVEMGALGAGTETEHSSLTTDDDVSEPAPPPKKTKKAAGVRATISETRKLLSESAGHDSWDIPAAGEPTEAAEMGLEDAPKVKAKAKAKGKAKDSGPIKPSAKETTSVTKTSGLMKGWSAPESSAESGWASSVAAPTTVSGGHSTSSGQYAVPPPPTPDSAKTRPQPKPKTAKASTYKTPLKISERGFVSEDEGLERDAAMSSPVKGKGKRATSDGMVTVTMKKRVESSDSEPQPKPKVKPQPDCLPDNDDPSRKKPKHRGSRSTSGGTSSSEKSFKLPPEQHTRFMKVGMPTVLRFLATLDNPWSFVEPGAAEVPERLEIVRKIWRATFGPNVDAPEPISLLSKIVTQKLSEWRSSMGNAAITHTDSWFKTNAALAFDHKERAIRSLAMMEQKRFLYEHPRSLGGLFCSPLVIKTLAYHFSYISSAVHVPGLYEFEEDSMQVGAIALAGAAVERAVWLYSEERVQVIAGTKIDYPPKPITAEDVQTQESKSATQFSDQLWGAPTRQYIKSVMNLGADRIRKITNRACPVIMISDDDEDTSRAMLVDNDPLSD